MRPFFSLKLRLAAGTLGLVLITLLFWGDELAASLGIPQRFVKALSIFILLGSILTLTARASKELVAWRQRDENSGKADADPEGRR
jgi:hypothetical protein